MITIVGAQRLSKTKHFKTLNPKHPEAPETLKPPPDRFTEFTYYVTFGCRMLDYSILYYIIVYYARDHSSECPGVQDREADDVAFLVLDGDGHERSPPQSSVRALRL